jgi:hypothetical protein
MQVGMPKMEAIDSGIDYNTATQETIDRKLDNDEMYGKSIIYSQQIGNFTMYHMNNQSSNLSITYDNSNPAYAVQPGQPGYAVFSYNESDFLMKVGRN